MIDPNAPRLIETDITQPIAKSDPNALIRMGALMVGKTKMGQRETAPNQGPIVDFSLMDFTRRKAGDPGPNGKPAWALWCLYFWAACVRDHLRATGQQELLAAWIKLQRTRIYGSCDAMHAWMHEGGMILKPGERPEPGDVFFTGKIGNLNHTGMVDEVGVKLIATCEGNHHDMVAREERPIAGLAAVGRLRLV